MKTNLNSLIKIHWKLWHRYIIPQTLIYWQNSLGETDIEYKTEAHKKIIEMI